MLVASFLSRREKPVPAASEFVGKQFQTKNRIQIYNRANMLNVQWHNHSLNLTEPAVDDFARAKHTSYYRTGHTTRGLDSVLRHFVAAG